MSNGIRSLPRYQHGGPHPHPDWVKAQAQKKLDDWDQIRSRRAMSPWLEAELAVSDDLAWRALEGAVPVEEQLSRGIGSLPEEPSWTRELGIPERGSGVPSLSAKQIAKLTPQEQMDRMLLQDFDRLAPVRAAILETPAQTPGFSGQRYHDVRKQFARRNPSAPIGWEHGAETVGDVYPPGQRPLPIPPPKRPGSFESYFPSDIPDMGRGGRGEIEGVLYEIMDADITEQEIARALDDPMFGPRVANLTNAEIDERVYARRYANARMGSPHSETRRQVTRQFMRQVPREFPEDAVWSVVGGTNLSDVEFERGMGERRKRLLLEHELGRLRDPSLPERNPYRTFFNEFAKPGERRPRHRSLPFKAGQAVRGAGITALRAIRNRLPAIIAGGVGAAAATHPVSALVDQALSPTQLGSGDIPREDPFSDEEKMRHYEELMSLGRELGVGQYSPSFFQPSRERGGPSIRSSYPMGR